jgi:hypothetical protein
MVGAHRRPLLRAWPPKSHFGRPTLLMRGGRLRRQRERLTINRVRNSRVRGVGDLKLALLGSWAAEQLHRIVGAGLLALSYADADVRHRGVEQVLPVAGRVLPPLVRVLGAKIAPLAATAHGPTLGAKTVAQTGPTPV